MQDNFMRWMKKHYKPVKSGDKFNSFVEALAICFKGLVLNWWLFTSQITSLPYLH
ncbi:hypothetical protein EV356DRAFT_538049 [Viridothelium virens]|uniref:Uncharacterized protein n=1 Tax=Viridothelium virens TaxID=1048519 RepID=A0A6A6GS52_VIRVR|nr:hypothetical protein EV356DRAFT_538049 [Viridothelium virens]